MYVCSCASKNNISVALSTNSVIERVWNCPTMNESTKDLLIVIHPFILLQQANPTSHKPPNRGKCLTVFISLPNEPIRNCNHTLINFIPRTVHKTKLVGEYTNQGGKGWVCSGRCISLLLYTQLSQKYCLLACVGF